MSKSHNYIVIFGILTAFLVGTMVSGPQAFAANPVLTFIQDNVMPKLDEILLAVQGIDTSFPSDTKTQIDNIETNTGQIITDIASLNTGVSATTETQIDNIESETNKIQMLKNDIMIPFVKKDTTLPKVCASAPTDSSPSVDKDAIRIASGLDREFLITGIFVKVQANAAGHEFKVTRISVDNTMMNIVSADLTGIEQPPSTKTAFEILGAKTIGADSFAREKDSFIPFQIAATDQIRIEIECTVPGGSFPTDLIIEEIIVSGWQRSHDIMLVNHQEAF